MKLGWREICLEMNSSQHVYVFIVYIIKLKVSLFESVTIILRVNKNGINTLPMKL